VWLEYVWVFRIYVGTLPQMPVSKVSAGRHTEGRNHIWSVNMQARLFTLGLYSCVYLGTFLSYRAAVRAEDIWKIYCGAKDEQLSYKDYSAQLRQYLSSLRGRPDFEGTVSDIFLYSS
jgi:hypothetical protein